MVVEGLREAGLPPETQLSGAVVEHLVPLPHSQQSAHAYPAAIRSQTEGGSVTLRHATSSLVKGWEQTETAS